MVQLEGQLADMEARLRDRNLMNASFAGDGEGGDNGLGEKIADLKSRIEGLGRPMGDIERFDVEGGYVFMIQDKVLFDLGSYDVGPEGQQALRELASTIQATPHGRVIVRGHTDNVPIAKPETKARLPLRQPPAFGHARRGRGGHADQPRAPRRPRPWSCRATVPTSR